MMSFKAILKWVSCSGLTSKKYNLNHTFPEFRKSLNHVEEMNHDTFRIFEMIRQPVVVAFVDLKNPNKKI